MSREKVSHDAIIVITNKKREVATFLIITLIVLIVLIALPIRLMALSVIRINNEIEGKRRLKLQLDTKISNFTQLNSEFQEIREDFSDFPLIFPSDGDYSLFLANLDEICKDNYFRLENISVTNSRTTPQKEEISFQELNFWDVNMSVVGRRSDLARLLEEIEAMPMYPTINVIGFKNEISEEGLLGYNISFRIYGVHKQNMYLDI